MGNGKVGTIQLNTRKAKGKDIINHEDWNDWITIYYEDIMLNPHQEIKSLVKALNLEINDKIKVQDKLFTVIGIVKSPLYGFPLKA